MKIVDTVMNSVWQDPRVTKQLRECVNRGLDVMAVGFKDEMYNKAEIERLPYPVKLSEIPFWVVKGRHNLLKTCLRELMKITRTSRIIRSIKPDVVHANDLSALIPALMAVNTKKCTVIYDSHEIYTENLNIQKRPAVKKLCKFIEKQCIKKCDVVVSVSHAAAEILAGMYNIPRLLVVTNCVSGRVQLANKKQDKFEVLMHGKYYKGRGYDTFIRAAKITENDADMVWVIRGFGPLKDSLKALKTELSLQNVRFDPPVDVSEMIYYASGSMVGVVITEPVCLNYIYTVSNKLFEYAAAGLPVIMSNLPEHRYLNGKYDFGIIIENDTPEDIAAAAQKLKQDTALYARLQKNALKMSAELSWDKEYGKLIEQYYHKKAEEL